MNATSHEKYPITWVQTKFVTGGWGWAGFCGKTRHLYRVLPRGDFGLLIIQDLIIENGRCEEGDLCLYFGCPLNTTNRKTYLRDVGFTKSRNAKPVKAEWGENEAPANWELTGGLITSSGRDWIYELY